MKTTLFFLFILNFLGAQHPDLTTNNWKITRYTSETHPYELPPPMPYEQGTTFSGNLLKASFFNAVTGDLTFEGQDKFSLTNKNCTYADYFGDNGEVGAFFLLICNFFNSSQFTYSIQNNDGEKTLVISSPIFQELHFKAANLATKNDNLSAATVYPNPVKTVLNIQKPDGIRSAKIFDLNGRLRYKHTADNVKVLGIDMNGFSAGTYLLQLNGSESVKIIKE